MTLQGELFEVAPVFVPDYTPDLTIDQRFALHHAHNPWIAEALCRLALDLHAKGRRRIGVKALVEVVRWQYDLRTDGDPWRIDNSLTSRYARLLIERHPELADAIETRTLRAA